MAIHVLIISYPIQGQVNPLLRLGKLLASMGGFLVTFTTTANFGKKIMTANDIIPDHLYPVGRGFLRFDFFDEEVAPETNPRRLELEFINAEMKRVGCKRIPQMIRRLADEGLPVSCLINGPIVPWVYDIGDELGIPVAMLWAQSCASFLTKYHFYKKLTPFPTMEDPYIDVEIPTLPLLKWDEIHTNLHPSYHTPYITKDWMIEFQNLNRPFCILMDTFNELESEIIEFTSKLCHDINIKPVGPFFKVNSGSLHGGNHLKTDVDCLQWLDSKPRNSVVYIAFGTYVHLKQDQIVEIAHGIIKSGFCFLWVMKPPRPDSGLKPHSLPAEFLEQVGDNGRVVEFSPQEEVLEHPSVGCFVTHCGWNSTMEALSSGAPVVVFPQFGDQVMNAKFLVDVFGVGVRMGRGEHEDFTPREDVDKCLREVMVGHKAEEMKKNALVWKDKALEAFHEGGSSYKNLQGFIEEIRRRSGDVVDKYTRLFVTNADGE